MLYALSKLKLICLNRELMWDDVYQVFMAKSTFLSPFLHVTFDVLCKDLVQGYIVYHHYSLSWDISRHTVDMSWF